jgi:hypothetical protein
MTLSCALMTLFLHVKTKHGAVINYTAPTVTFVFLLLYAIATVMFCFAASTFFSTGTLSDHIRWWLLDCLVYLLIDW